MEHKTYQQMLDSIQEQNNELREDDGAEAKEKYNFLLEQCTRMMKFGEIILSDDYKGRIEFCTMLLEIAEHYKTYIPD